MQFLTLSAAVCLCALASAQPQFQEGPVLSSGTAALLEAVGDFNNDGAPDIAAIAGNSVIIYLSADSQFSQTEVPVGCAVTAIAAGHFSGIGPAGVAFACAGSATVGLISQTGSGFAVTGTTSGQRIAHQRWRGRPEQ